jgi:hypothetical protein
MSSSAPVYSEVQYYRELPPFTLLTVVGALFGWFLIVWVVALGRPLGALVVPPWLALAIGLPLGVLLPLAYFQLRMVTEVYPDRVTVNNGMSGRVSLPLAEVTAVDQRDEDIHGDYNVRNVATERVTRIAYTVGANAGIQLSLPDGRQILIGSKQPEALAAAVLAAWRAARPAPLGEVVA